MSGARARSGSTRWRTRFRGPSPAMSPCFTAVVTIVAERGLIPLIDIAYQGFGRGLDEDAFGVRLMLSACDEVIVAQSCDKNFSVYRDRVGSLWVKTASAETTATAMGHVFQLA